MKKTLAIVMIFILALSFAACSTNGEQPKNDDTNSLVSNLEAKYPGYFANFEEGIISVTNYDPNNLGDLPDCQEMVDYGDGAGMENDGTVYCVYILDAKNTTEKNEIYYYAELADETLEVLTEENTYFDSDEEKDAAVKKLIEIMDYVKDNK